MLIQQLHRDVKEHRDLFVLLPFRRAWQHAEYRWALGFLVVLVAALVHALVTGNDGWMAHRGLMVAYLTPIILMVPRIHRIIEQSRSNAVEDATGIMRPVGCDLSTGLRLQELAWFQRKYPCSPDMLVHLAKQKEQFWRDWQNISSRAASDEMDDIVRFYFRLPESGRFMTLMAAALAVVATLVITLGASQQAYFDLLDSGWDYLEFVLLATLICAYLALPLLFLKGLLRTLIGSLDDWLGRHTVSERSFYRFIRSMIWAAGVDSATAPLGRNLVSTFEGTAELLFQPLSDVAMVVVNGTLRGVFRIPFWLTAVMGIVLFSLLAF